MGALSGFNRILMTSNLRFSGIVFSSDKYSDAAWAIFFCLILFTLNSGGPRISARDDLTSIKARTLPLLATISISNRLPRQFEASILYPFATRKFLAISSPLRPNFFSDIITSPHKYRNHSDNDARHDQPCR